VRGYRRVLCLLAAAALVPVAQMVSTAVAPPAHALSNSVPFVVDPAVNNTVPNFATTDTTCGSEPSVALNPSNVQQAVMTSFSGGWGANAPLWYTNNGGQTWTQEFSIPNPPGNPGGCPCDQTVDYDRNNRLYGTFLIATPQPPNPANTFNVVSGDTTDPTNAASWQWNGSPAQLTNNAHANNSDQPWLLVNRDTGAGTTDNTYVAYDEFTGSTAQVAASLNAAPHNFTVDQSPGTETPFNGANPGLRLAKDPRNGWMYSIWQTAGNGGNMCSPFNTSTTVGGCPAGSTQSILRDVTLHVNRSTDQGSTWSLAGTGTSIHTGNQDEYDWSFGGVNTLQGGIEHAAVDPTNGDVYVVYGQDTDAATATNYNSIFVQRLSYNGANLDVNGAPVQIGTSTNAALPSIAVTSDGTVGVLYDTYDGNNGSGVPTFTAHLARKAALAATYTDTVLKSFATTAAGTTPPTQGQRDFGDFQQLKANGNDFFGTFSGNRQAFSPTANNVIDPIFFSTATPNADLGITKTGVPDPVTPGGIETYTITVQNHGPYDALAVSLTDTLPAGTTFQSLINPGWVCTAPPVGSPGTVTCTTPTLANLASAVFQLQVHVNASVPPGTTLSNTATVTSTTPDLGPNPNSATATATVNCTNNVTGTVPGNLTASGGTWCINNANIGGVLNVSPGTTVFLIDSSVTGRVSANKPAGMAVCNTTIGGTLRIRNSTGLVVVGDPSDDGCSPNDIHGAVTLSGNHGAEITQNTIGGNLLFKNNHGISAFFDDNVPEVAGNNIGGNLKCTGNTGFLMNIKNDGLTNSVAGNKTGQCATL